MGLLGEGSRLEWQDLAVIGAYFIGVLIVGLVSSYSSKRGSISGYFLASRNMHWIPVGASLFASNIGSGHFIGLAGSGAASGIGIGAFELNAIFVLMFLGWVFVPVYMSAGVYTMPEYLRERFGGQRIRVYLSVLALILYVFTKISADLFAGALFIQITLDKSSVEWLYISVLILLAIAAIFTIGGGLTAVIWTDFVQTILMIIGAFILMVKSFEKVGGYDSLVENYFKAEPNHTIGDCGKPPDYAMNLFRPVGPGESDLPWTGVLTGATISSIWYWCTDQVIVQRTLASKNMTHAKGGCILAAVLKFLPMFLLVFPGMAARILFTDRVACVIPEECDDICGTKSGCTNIAYVELVLNLLPPGLRGLMLAVMLAALMSSLTSIFNSASTIFTIDIWTRIHKKATDVEKLVVGRVFVLVLVGISVVWIPVIQNSPGSQLFVYIQSISAFLSPPICAVYLLAIFWKRTNEPGAFWGLIIGFVIGMARFAMEFAFVIPPCGSDEEDSRPEWIKLLVDQIHYLHFGVLLLVIVIVITVAISLITPPIPEECLYRLTFASRHCTKVRKPLASKKASKNRMDISGVENAGFADGGGGANQVVASTKPVAASPESPSSVMKFLQALCCVKSEGDPSSALVDSQEPELTPGQQAVAAAAFLKEEKTWATVVNAGAIIVMICAAFMWGFYA